MTSVLLCGFASTGTAEDLVGVAAALLRRGHRVTVIAGAPAAHAYSGLDVTFVPVIEPPLPVSRLGRPPLSERIEEVFEHVRSLFVEPTAAQWAVVRQTIVAAEVEVVLTDGLFLGAAILAYLPRSVRPAVVDLGIFPLAIPDSTVPPYGFGIPPIESFGARLQAIGLEIAAAVPYVKLTRAFTATVEQLTGIRPRGGIRSACLVADVWAQLTVPRFEYPRTVLPGNVRYVGALHPARIDRIPAWWSPDDRRQVVAVLTDVGAELADLVLPTIEAFAGEDVLMVVAGTTRDEVAARLEGPLPDSVHFESDMPWDYLARERTVLVSTGNYVHAQYALRYGIPVVAAGTFGNQIETAARVDWAGIGVDLHTRRPDAALVRRAVEWIQTDPSIRFAVARIAAQMAGHDAEETLADLVDELVPVVPAELRSELR